jgi:hypothetical protein
MAIDGTQFRRRLRQSGRAALLALVMIGLGPPALALAETAGGPATPAMAPGTARIWIYREY